MIDILSSNTKENRELQKEDEINQVVGETKEEISTLETKKNPEHTMTESYSDNFSQHSEFSKKHGIYLSDNKGNKVQFDRTGKGMGKNKEYYVRGSDGEIQQVIFQKHQNMVNNFIDTGEKELPKGKDGNPLEERPIEISYGENEVTIEGKNYRIAKYIIDDKDLRNFRSCRFGFKILTEDETVDENTGRLISIEDLENKKFEDMLRNEDISEKNKEVLKILNSKDFNITIKDGNITVEKDGYKVIFAKDAELSFKHPILTVVEKNGKTTEVDLLNKKTKEIKNGSSEVKEEGIESLSKDNQNALKVLSEYGYEYKIGGGNIKIWNGNFSFDVKTEEKMVVFGNDYHIAIFPKEGADQKCKEINLITEYISERKNTEEVEKTKKKIEESKASVFKSPEYHEGENSENKIYRLERENIPSNQGDYILLTDPEYKKTKERLTELGASDETLLRVIRRAINAQQFEGVSREGKFTTINNQIARLRFLNSNEFCKNYKSGTAKTDKLIKKFLRGMEFGWRSELYNKDDESSDVGGELYENDAFDRQNIVDINGKSYTINYYINKSHNLKKKDLINKYEIFDESGKLIMSEDNPKKENIVNGKTIKFDHKKVDTGKSERGNQLTKITIPELIID